MIAKFACGASKLKKSEIVFAIHRANTLFILIDVDFAQPIFSSSV